MTTSNGQRWMRNSMLWGMACCVALALAACPKQGSDTEEKEKPGIALKALNSPKQQKKLLRAQLDAALEADNREASREIARRLVDADPTDQQAWRVAIRGYLALEEYAIAEGLVSAWRQAAGQDIPDMTLFSGDVAKGQGKNDLAAEFWKGTVEKLSGQAQIPALDRLIALRSGLGEWAEALKWIHDRLRLADDVDLQVQRARTALRARAWAEAEEAGQRVETAQPGHEALPKLLPLLGRVKVARAKLDGLDDALRMAPADLRILTDRASVENEVGLHDNALEDAMAALRVDARHLPALRQQVHALNNLGRGQEALAIATAACEGPGAADAVLWFYRGMFEEQNGSHLAAEWALSRSLDLQEGWAALEWRAAALRKLGREREAIRDALRAEQIKGTR